MAYLSDKDIIQKFLEDADRIRNDRETPFLMIEERTARSLLAYLGEDPAADFLKDIDWDRTPLEPLTKYATMRICEYIYTQKHAIKCI